MIDNSISIHQIANTLESHSQNFQEIRERIQALESRLDDLIDSDRWKHKEVEAIGKEVHSLKKIVFGTGKQGIENTLSFQTKEMIKISSKNQSQIILVIQRLEDYDRWLRYIIICLFLITIVTIASAAGNLIWFILELRS
jgi:hypothetical protein